ncbi:PKHD-type hydroxylase [Mesorhizobium sp. J18]|uniref:Fe2+-dependent dioxygenase n=1 Tax=Mesorhizobium sp. J18 TaxID=935263 RepID=UPI0011992FD8|nr:Fe2+-dependent dioxygenase [Mesorhizobium sp. J18]TWG97455.1 PKHD-type hydroxylase [Mesorhizobium sp. J18]
MYLIIPEVLSPEEVEEARGVISRSDFADGRETAGWHARLVKKNEQARRGSPEMEALKRKLSAKLLENALFRSFVRPKALTPLIISRYREGMTYGSHVDDAIMGGIRTDVSFTLFLSDETTYDGGALVIESTAGEDDVRLPAGSLVAYPSTTLHRVEPVTRGERLAAVGWARSFVRDPASREILFDLDNARQMLFEAGGKTPAFDLVSKAQANLVRRWAED